MKGVAEEGSKEAQGDKPPSLPPPLPAMGTDADAQRPQKAPRRLPPLDKDGQQRDPASVAMARARATAGLGPSDDELLSDSSGPHIDIDRARLIAEGDPDGPVARVLRAEQAPVRSLPPLFFTAIAAIAG